MPRTLLRSKTFSCPTCEEGLRVRQLSRLWGLPLVACGYTLTFVVAEKMGLKGNGLLMVTVFLGPVVGILVGVVLGLVSAWVFRIPPPLERDPGLGFEYSGVLHIDSQRRSRKGPM